MPIEPDDAELLEEVIKSFLLDVHVMMPAVCVSYDAAKQRGSFQPTVKSSVKDSDGQNVFTARPIIQNVPVLWKRAGGYYSHRPLAKWDSGILVFSEDAWAHWRDTGELSEPGDVTRHSIAYCTFLPGLFADAKPMADAPASGEGVEIVPAGGHVRFSKEGSVSADFVALAAKVDANFAAIKNMFTSWTPVPNDGGAALKSLSASLTLGATPGTSLKSD